MKNKEMRNKLRGKEIPTVKFNSEYFKCSKCGYAEARLILGDVSYTPCPKCGNSPMYRVK